MIFLVSYTSYCLLDCAIILSKLKFERLRVEIRSHLAVPSYTKSRMENLIDA